MATQKKTKNWVFKVSKGAKIRNRYNQVPHLTQDTYVKETNSQLDTTNESQEVSPFPAGDHKAYINRHVQRHSKHKTELEMCPWDTDAPAKFALIGHCHLTKVHNSDNNRWILSIIKLDLYFMIIYLCIK